MWRILLIGRDLDDKPVSVLRPGCRFQLQRRSTGYPRGSGLWLRKDHIREMGFFHSSYIFDKIADRRHGAQPCGTSSAHLDKTRNINGCHPPFEFTYAGLARSVTLKGSLATQPGLNRSQDWAPSATTCLAIVCRTKTSGQEKATSSPARFSIRS